MIVFIVALATKLLKPLYDLLCEDDGHPKKWFIGRSLSNNLLAFYLFILTNIALFVHVLFLIEKLWIAVGPLYKIDIFYVILLLVAFGSFSSLHLDIDAVLQPYLLRFCIHLEGQLPLRLVPWLEAMQQRKVLQRAGGSYRFLHKQLQEYLAKQE